MPILPEGDSNTGDRREENNMTVSKWFKAPGFNYGENLNNCFKAALAV